MTTLDEVAKVAAFIASDRASAITGDLRPENLDDDATKIATITREARK